MWSNCNCCCGYGEAVSFFQQACFSIMGALPSYHIFFPPHESLNSPIVTWNGTLKSKNVIKIWTTKWVNFLLSLVHSWLPKPTAGRKPSVLPSTEFLGGCPPSTDQTLMENRGGSHSWLTKPAASRKPLVLPSPEFLGRCAPLYRPNPNGKPWWVQFMTTKACCRQKTFILPSPEFLGGCALYRPNPNGKPHWVQVRALVGFQEAKPKNVLAF